MRAVAVEVGDDRHAIAADHNKPVLRSRDAGLLGEGEREDSHGGDVPDVVGLGKIRNGEPAIREADSGLGTRTTKAPAGTEQETEIFGGLGLAVNRVRGGSEATTTTAVSHACWPVADCWELRRLPKLCPSSLACGIGG